MADRDPDHILPLSSWQMTGGQSQKEWWNGRSAEDRVARKGWHGQNLCNLSHYERLRAHRFCTRVRQQGRGALISRTQWTDDHDPTYKIYYNSPEVGVWFEQVSDYLSFVGQLELWPTRTVEFMIDREPDKDEVRLLKGLNHLIINVMERETGDQKWLVSTEYHSRVVEFRLRLA